MIFDTSFIIDVMNGDKSATQKLKEIEDSTEHESISTATVHELYTGLKQSERPEKEKRKIANTIESKNIIKFDKNSAIKSGKIEGALENNGLNIPPQDCMIAGTASQNSEKILSNDSDFEEIAKITDIEVENY